MGSQPGDWNVSSFISVVLKGSQVSPKITFNYAYISVAVCYAD